jgi:hypothetical protein
MTCANCNRDTGSTTARFCRMCWSQLPQTIRNAVKRDDDGVDRAVVWLYRHETETILNDFDDRLAEGRQHE